MAEEKKSNKRGRKSLYESNVLPNLDKIRQWMINRNSDEFIADSLGIGYSTWFTYKQKKEILELIEETPKSRAALIEEIRQAQIQAAKGYEYEETKTIIVTDEKTGKPKILRKEVYKKRALPNPNAAKEVSFFLGDDDSSLRASFNLKAQEFEFRREQAKAESEEWAVIENEEIEGSDD